jgi:hypothetical protein
LLLNFYRDYSDENSGDNLRIFRYNLQYLILFLEHIMKKRSNIIIGWLVGGVIIFGLSYWSELPKYRFEQMSLDLGNKIQGARLIDYIKEGNFISPISWFWAARTTINFALPDPIVDRRFYIMSLTYGERDPVIFLADVDCGRREWILYDLDEPESAIPALSLWGEPIVAPNGKVYRHVNWKDSPPSKWMAAFCDTDWTAERKAAAAASM